MQHFFFNFLMDMRLCFILVSLFISGVLRAHCTAVRSRQGVVSANSEAPEKKADEEEAKESEENEKEEETEKEAETEAEEMDYSLAAKNLETEINHREQLQLSERKAEQKAEKEVEKVEAKPPACSVQQTGKLLVAKDPTDVLSVGPFAATIAKRHFTVHYPDHPEAPFIKIPIIEIQTPLETLKRSRRCFRLFHKGSPRLLCAETTAERNNWMKSIYKAIFCINTEVRPPESSAPEVPPTEKGEQVELPDKSTKVERWTAQQTKQREKMFAEAEGGEVEAKEEQKGVPEIEISAGQFGQPPKVSVNGDEIAVPTLSKTEDKMNAGSMEP